MQITVQSNLSRISRLPDAIARQFRIAAEKALNDSAFKARESLGKHSKLVFDSPVPRTIGAGMVEKAKRGKLYSRVYLREDMDAGIQPGKYLRAEIGGGRRRDKRLERALRATKFSAKTIGTVDVLPQGWMAVPHPSITNKNDNLTAPRSRAIIADMKKNGRGKKYFLVHPKSARPSGIIPGIYYRVGKKIKIAIVYVEDAKISYRKKYKFYKVGMAAADRWFPIFMRKHFNRAIKTMRV